MTVRDIANRQARQQIARAAKASAARLTVPAGGWIAAMRTALGMSGAQLGKRLGRSRSRVSQAEKAELEGGVTLRTMHEMAEAMGGRFVYAILPAGGTVDEIAEAQARKKAAALVGRVSAHMALEDQALSAAQNRKEVERIARALLKDPPPDFWTDP